MRGEKYFNKDVMEQARKKARQEGTEERTHD